MTKDDGIANPRWADDLPDSRSSSKYAPFWEALAANPGRWAEWPGSPLTSLHALVAHRSRNGRQYEGRNVAGKKYVRCVKP